MTSARMNSARSVAYSHHQIHEQAAAARLVADLLSEDQDWSADTLDMIANTLRAAGLTIRDCEPHDPHCSCADCLSTYIEGFEEDGPDSPAAQRLALVEDAARAVDLVDADELEQHARDLRQRAERFEALQNDEIEILRATHARLREAASAAFDVDPGAWLIAFHAASKLEREIREYYHREG